MTIIAIPTDVDVHEIEMDRHFFTVETFRINRYVNVFGYTIKELAFTDGHFKSRGRAYRAAIERLESLGYRRVHYVKELVFK